MTLSGTKTVLEAAIGRGMSKTKRRNPNYISEDDRWMKKGGSHRGPSRKKQKQNFLREIEDVENVYR